jgi:predicted transcriptional regulator
LLQFEDVGLKLFPLRQIQAMSAKEVLLEVAEKLPPNATISDAIYELEFRQAVQQGLDELDRGEGVPIEEVKARIAQWAGK